MFFDTLLAAAIHCMDIYILFLYSEGELMVFQRTLSVGQVGGNVGALTSKMGDAGWMSRNGVWVYPKMKNSGSSNIQDIDYFRRF